MNSKLLPIVAACVFLGSGALAQAQQAGQRPLSRAAASVHKAEKRGDARHGGISDVAARKAVRRGDTTGSGSAGDDAFADDRGDHREGRMRGDRGADMMDNVRRVGEEPSE